VPASSVLGGEAGRGRGFYQMMDGVEVGRVNVAARGCGVMRRAFELAIAYAQQRQTFGKPIADHQAIAFKLAEMATDLQAARSLVLDAARRWEQGGGAISESAMAKLFASEMLQRVTDAALQVHGGSGYWSSSPIERVYRDARAQRFEEGTAEIQKTTIARELLR
jgi:butyryl-CoA dehydrogenase